MLLPPFEYEEVALTLTIDGETFHARGKVVKEPGWRAAYDRSFDLEEEDSDEEQEQSLPELRQGDRLTVQSVRMVPGKTAPPKRYTEATLLTAMEHPAAQVRDKDQSKILEETGGLGTPATRADIIEKLFSAFYIERRGDWPPPTCVRPPSRPSGSAAWGRSPWAGKKRRLLWARCGLTPPTWWPR